MSHAKLLIVDSNRERRGTLKEHFERREWEVLASGDSQDAKLQKNFMPDLIICQFEEKQDIYRRDHAEVLREKFPRALLLRLSDKHLSQLETQCRERASNEPGHSLHLIQSAASRILAGR